MWFIDNHQTYNGFAALPALEPQLWEPIAPTYLSADYLPVYDIRSDLHVCTIEWINKFESNETIDKNKRNSALSDVQKLKASIVELESISAQASHLTRELVCCRQELMQLRTNIKNCDHKDKEYNTTDSYDNDIDKIKIISINDNLNNHCLNGFSDKKKLINNNFNITSNDTKNQNNSQLNQIKQNKDLETIRKLNGELKEAQSNYDFLEIAYERLTKRVIEMERIHESDLNLMKDRINDLTNKLIASDRLLRLAKQKISKFESKQERRRSSLKGKVTLCADV